VAAAVILFGVPFQRPTRRSLFFIGRRLLVRPITYFPPAIGELYKFEGDNDHRFLCPKPTRDLLCPQEGQGRSAGAALFSVGPFPFRFAVVGTEKIGTFRVVGSFD
jgi:hypothetical protein